MPRKAEDGVHQGIDPWQRGRGFRIHEVFLYIKERKRCKLREITGHFSYHKAKDGHYVSWHPDTTEGYVNELQNAGLVLIVDDEVVYLEPKKEQTHLDL